MVCASSMWAREPHDAAPDEQLWLKLNSGYMFVAEPLWFAMCGESKCAEFFRGIAAACCLFDVAGITKRL